MVGRKTSGSAFHSFCPAVGPGPMRRLLKRPTSFQAAKTVRNVFLTRVPTGRLGEPEDLAGPLLFLSSRASDFYTGHILYADGGYSAGWGNGQEPANRGDWWRPDGPRHCTDLCSCGGSMLL